MTAAELARLHAAGIRTPRPWTETELAGLLSDPACFLVESPAGFALGRGVLDEAELLTLVVAPEARRRGTGRSLLSRFEAAAGGRGCRRAFLEVAADNAAARALYLAAGWVEDGLRRGYYRTPDGSRIDAVLMSKALGATAAGP